MLPNPFREPILPPEETDAEVNARLLAQLGVNDRGVRIGREPDGKPRVTRVSKAELLAAAKAATEKAYEEIGTSTNPLENPRGYLRFATNLYQEQNLPEWIPTEETLTRLKNISPENKALIEREIKEGAIAILMPGRAIQEQTLAKAIQQLKPLWIENGEEQELKETAYDDRIDKFISQKNDALFKDIPVTPYLLLTKPTQRPPQNTVDKFIYGQLAELHRMQEECPELHAMNISGYIALQSWATRIEHRINTERVRPLDGATTTRFIELQVPGGDILSGGFIRAFAQMSLGVSGAGYSYSTCGFRVEVRVKL